MEFLLDLLPALFIFWFIIRALRGSGRRRVARGRAGQAARTPAGGRGTAFSGFEELVRRLEEAAAEAQQQQEATVQAAPPALGSRFPTPPPVPPRAEDEFDFRSVESAAPDFSYVGGLGEGEQPTEFHETHPLEVAYALPDAAGAVGGPSGDRAHPLVERLRSQASAREALLLKDILSAPRSRSAGRR